MCLKLSKTALFDWMTQWKFLISIIQFLQGKADQVSGASFLLSSVVNFGQILLFSFTRFENFFPYFY